MISEIQVTNFKSYRSASLPLDFLTVLIGANASGKSNVIEALRLLARIATGEKLKFLENSHQETDKIFRGKISDLGYQGEKSFQVSCNVTTEKFADWHHFEIDRFTSVD